MPDSLYQEDLDTIKCSSPGCNHDHCEDLYLHAACHPKAGLEVLYSKMTGELQVLCHECDEVVVVVKLMSRAAEEALFVKPVEG